MMHKIQYLFRYAVFILFCLFCGCFDFSSTAVPPVDGADEEPDGIDLPDTDMIDGLETDPIDGIDTLDVADVDGEGTTFECGNSIVEGDEECDDGRNGDPDDGCTDDCLYSCHNNAECRDSQVCDGDERCNDETHVCEPGNPRMDGFVCLRPPRSICLAGECTESVCGDGFTDTGGDEFCDPPDGTSCLDGCRTACSGDEDCTDDANACNGTEACNTATGLCERSDPLAEGTLCGDRPRKICIAGTCQDSRCGDGFIDDVIEEECDDENLDEGDGCENDCRYSCHDETECDDGLDCTDDICDSETTHMCRNPVSEPGTLCRPMAGDCDVEELCNGVSTDCPMDAYASNVTICRPAVDACDRTELCTGASPRCPDDFHQDAGTVCDDGNYCTGDDRCDGSGGCAGTPIENLYGVTSIYAGYNHACVLVSTGEIRCWGTNRQGQLGIGSSDIVPHTAPERVILSAAATAIAAGTYHSCALLDTGDVNCWGQNDEGQLGDGSMFSSEIPVRVGLSVMSPVTALSCGRHHCCVLLESGSIWCWGRNNEGQLGDGTTEIGRSPVEVIGLGFPATQISCGRYHTCALLDTAEVYCWGHNFNGELGDGTDVNSSIPVAVTGLGSGALAVAAGGYHTCALLDTGSVMCWADNGDGQLGDGSTGDSLSPVDVAEMPSEAVAIALGGYHTAAVLDTGSVMAWGRNTQGQIGDGTSTDPVVLPTEVVGLRSSAERLSLGFYFSCALLDTGGVMCWGENGNGELGDGSTDDSPTPVNVLCQ